MRRLRFWIIVFIVWFFFLYNIDELSEPLNIASFVYVFTALCSIAMILVRPLYKSRIYWSLGIALPIFLLFKLWLNYEIAGKNLTITISEIAIIEFTILLARQVGRGLDDLREAIQFITVDRFDRQTQSFDSGQSLIYREIRRARHHQQHASILAVKPAEESVALSINHFIHEAMQDISKNYISARVANFLVQELNDSDIVTKRNHHMIALLPEAGQDEATAVAHRLEAAANEKIGVHLKIGIATFPEEAVTFESLLERAEKEMEQNPILADQKVGHSDSPIELAGSELMPDESKVAFH